VRLIVVRTTSAYGSSPLPPPAIFLILALEHYSLTTALFPAAVGLACMVLAVLIAYRRRALLN